MPCILPLAIALGRHGRTSAISLGAAWPTTRNEKWSLEDSEGRVVPKSWTYPPGFNGRLAPLFRPVIKARVRRELGALSARDGRAPWLIAPYPYLLRYVEDCDPARLVYFNHDDHSAYGDGNVTSERLAEAALIERAGTILCNSKHQTDRFKAEFPTKADSIFHIPHGVHESAINPAPGHPVKTDSVCAVGALSRRYDWKLIHDVARRLSQVRFTFVGRLDFSGAGWDGSDWLGDLKAALALPNVQHLEPGRDWELAQHYWTSGVNWMPYDTRWKFVQACSPLKLFTGLASGRRTLSADVPECRLYPEWISIFSSTDAAVELIRDALQPRGDEANRAVRQTEFVRNHTWQVRADRFLEIVERRGGSAR